MAGIAAEFVDNNRITGFQAERLQSDAPLSVGNYLLLLSHPNIVTAHDADEADGVHFLVMELVAGRDLASLVRSRGPLPCAEAVGYVVQAAHGLAQAHAAGVIHRDVKPSNLLLDGNGVLKVSDFGLARLPSSARDGYTATRVQLTHSSTVLGTVDFLAPEQARNIKDADHRSDIYGLGCTLYYLLTGRPMYPGRSMMEKIAAHQKQPIPPLVSPHGELPTGLHTVFRRIVAKQPDQRPQSMSELIETLQPYASSGDTTVRSGEITTPLSTPARPPARSRSVWMIAGGCCPSGA